MSLPGETEAFIGGRIKAGSSELRAVGPGPERAPRPIRIFRRFARIWNATSAPDSEAMNDPEISVGRQAAIAAILVGVEALEAAVTEGAARAVVSEETAAADILAAGTKRENETIMG